MVILIDMDSTIVDLMSKWLAVYNREWGDNLRRAAITNWNLHEFVRPECGGKVYDIIRRPGFFRDLPPIEGAIDAITFLRCAGHTVEIASAPAGANSEVCKRGWVDDHLGDDTVLHLRKADKKAELNGHVLIDDNAETIRAWEATHRPVMTIAYPYNRCVRHLCETYAQDYRTTARAWREITQSIMRMGNA